MLRSLFERSGLLVAAVVGVLSGFQLFDKPLREAAARKGAPSDGAAW
jgi:hypothetical protein